MKKSTVYLILGISSGIAAFLLSNAMLLLMSFMCVCTSEILQKLEL